MQDLFTCSLRVRVSRISYRQSFVTKGYRRNVSFETLCDEHHSFSRKLSPLFIFSLPYLSFVFSSHNREESLPINLSQAR